MDTNLLLEELILDKKFIIFALIVHFEVLMLTLYGTLFDYNFIKKNARIDLLDDIFKIITFHLVYYFNFIISSFLTENIIVSHLISIFVMPLTRKNFIIYNLFYTHLVFFCVGSCTIFDLVIFHLYKKILFFIICKFMNTDLNLD
jgi:hypothetical protein